MKKTIVRVVAIAVLAVMLLSALPAFAAVTGTVASTTTMYKKPSTSSSAVASIKGAVTVLYQSNDGQFYQVTITKDGNSVTGWVPKSAVTNLSNGSSNASTSTGSSGVSTGSTPGSSSTNSTNSASGKITGNVSTKTAMYDESGKLIANFTGNVVVNSRDASSTKLNVTVSKDGSSYTGWVSASAVGSLFSNNSGSITLSQVPTTSTTVGSVGGTYTAYSTAKAATSLDRTIYIRKTASSSTSSSNVVSKVRDAKGSTFSVLGTDSTGAWYYVSYNGVQGYVRAQDFSITGASSGTTTTTTAATTYQKALTGVSNDKTIYVRATPSKETSGNTVVKVVNARGKAFTLLGESGDWYYAQYETYKGYVKKADFTITDATAAAQSASTTTSGTSAGIGTKSSSEKWGSITVPGGSTYGIYGNYTNKAKNMYYYDYNNIKSYDYVHTTTAKGSQIAAVMGHNMRKSTGYFHKFHHVQNALRGDGSCQGCGGSTSSYNTTTVSASWEGYSKWAILCLYEIPSGASTSILEYNARPWRDTTANYLSKQLSYAKNSSYKGWVNPSVSADANGQYMMLITCGDKYESSSSATSKLYVLLRAIS